MRLRRLELLVIGLTLAFACFIGGFFAGRSWSAVNIITTSPHREDTQQAASPALVPQDSVTESTGTAGTESSTGNTVSAGNSAAGQDQGIVGAPRGGDGKININLASQAELMDLPGIGSVLASRIVDYRRQHGDFSRIEDIRNVSGIGEKRFDSIKDKITVG